MKKAAAIIGSICLFLITFGTLFKIQHYPGASIMLVVGIGFLSSLFIPVYFISRIIDSKSTVGKIGNGFAIFSLSIFFMGILFKIQHYPGAGIMLIVGGLSSIFPTAILLMIAGFEKESELKDYLKGIVITAFVSAWILILALSKFSGETVSQLLLIDEEFTSSVSAVEEESDRLISELRRSDVVDNTELSQLISLTQKRAEICTFIDEKMVIMIEEVGGFGSAESRGNWEVPGVRDSDISPRFMIHGGVAIELKRLLEEYDMLANECTIQKDTPPITLKKSTELLLPNHVHSNWEQSLFDNTPLFITLPVLTSIKSRVLITERTILKARLSK